MAKPERIDEVIQASTTDFIAQCYEFYQSQLEMLYVDATTDIYTSSLDDYWKLYKDVATKVDIVEFAKLAGTSIGYRETGGDFNRTK